MKRFTMTVTAAIALCVGMHAQQEKNIELDEVTVETAQVVNKPDGQLLFPTAVQKKMSTNAYNLLAKLPLPTIRIDEVTRSITSLSNQGEVQVRINGIRVGREELIALNTALVRHVDFISNPGVRYGTGVACVIDIKTNRDDAGYSLGIDASNTLTACNGNNEAFFKRNYKKAEFGLFYHFSYRDFYGRRQRQEANYLLNDGTVRSISRHDLAARNRNFGNKLELKYSLADSSTYIFQATLSGDFAHVPNDWTKRRMRHGATESINISLSNEKTFNPVLDLYFYRALNQRQSLTANLTGTHIGTNSNVFNNEGSPYRYSIGGDTWSLMGEAIYENRLQPFTLSLGSQFNVKHIHNRYSGDVNSLNRMNTRGLYLFGEANGRLWDKIGYVAGIGVSNQHYNQTKHRYDFWLFRPKFTISYALSASWSMRYMFEFSQHISAVAMISDTRIRQNSMEWLVGNPDIEPNGVATHSVRFAFTKPRIMAMLNAEYQNHYHPNMVHWTRTDTDQFLQSQRNQGAIKMFYVCSDVRCDIIPEKITFSANGGFFRFINNGDDYQHRYSSFNWGANLQTYLEHFVFTVYADNGWRWQEGETRGWQGAAMYLGGNYHVGNCTIGIYWQHPFDNTPLIHRAEVVNRYVNKTTNIVSKDYGNMITLNFTWKLNHGRVYKSLQRRLNNKDTETGIIK